MKPGEQTSGSIEIDGQTIGFLSYLPSAYTAKSEWPLLLFLHGAGERGDDIALVARHGPPKLAAGGQDFPFIIISPQQKKGVWWKAGPLLALLDHIQSQYRLDPDRIYVTGLSMGGFGTWGLLAEAPHRFAAAAPIAGGGKPALACDMQSVPVWAIHGAQDPVIPVDRSREMIAALRACGGGDVRYTEYPDAGHDSWTKTYADAALYNWLLSHRR